MKRRILGVVTALVVVLGATFASSTAATAAVSKSTTEHRIAASVLSMLNRERKAHHRAPLTMSTKLILSAHRHNVAMSRAGELSHQLPGEAGLGTRITRAGYSWSYAGENIGVTSRTNGDGARQLESLMYGEKPPEDGHRQNILRSQFKNVGIDVVIDSHGKLWLTEDFGRPL